jgi:hypothetical protein
LRLHASRRRHTLPRQRAIGRRQETSARQFRHFFFVVRSGLLAAAGNAARRPWLIGKDIANLRAGGRRKRNREASDKGRKNGQDEGSEHLVVRF